uniref:Uncharacterized protein n=1 Tax=Anotrichium furcellatum TaxID=41999 RepID=A0A4D6WKJ6_9FLOR|nr:hypothetical protein [Anotrichium furcellatum]
MISRTNQFKHELKLKLFLITIEALDINIHDNIMNSDFSNWRLRNYKIDILTQYKDNKSVIKYLLINYIIRNKYHLQIIISKIIKAYIDHKKDDQLRKYSTKFIYLYYKVFTYYENRSHLYKLRIRELAIHNLYLLNYMTQNNAWYYIYDNIL